MGESGRRADACVRMEGGEVVAGFGSARRCSYAVTDPTHLTPTHADHMTAVRSGRLSVSTFQP